MFKIWLNYGEGKEKVRKEIDVHGEWTVGQLRNKIFQETGYTFQDQIKVMSEGRDITQDGRTLNGLNIKEGVSISAVREIQDDHVPIGVMASSHPSFGGSLINAEGGAPTSNDLFADETPHRRIMRIVMFSPWFTGFTLLLALLSIIFFIVGLVRGSPKWLTILDLLVTIFFAIEIIFRIKVFPHFWSSCFNIFDCILLTACIIETIVTLAVDINSTLGIGMLAFRFIVRLIRSVQLLRHQREYRSQQATMNEEIDMTNFDPKMFNLKTFEQIEGDFVAA